MAKTSSVAFFAGLRFKFLSTFRLAIHFCQVIVTIIV